MTTLATWVLGCPRVAVVWSRNKDHRQWALGMHGLKRLSLLWMAVLVPVLVCMGVGFAVALVPFLMGTCLKKGCRLFRKTESRNPLQDNDVALESYALSLPWEGDFYKQQFMTSELKNMDKCMESARKNQVRDLVELIKSHSTISEGFKGVGLWLAVHESPNRWAYPVLALATIAAGLPGIDRNEVKSLLHGVVAGLRFVGIIDRNNAQTSIESKIVDFANPGCIYVYRSWLDRGLHCLTSPDNANGKMIIEELERQIHIPSMMPDLQATNCMSTVCATIRHRYDLGKRLTNNHLFSWLQMVISDILGACLTNMPRAIRLEIQSSQIEVSKRRVRDAVRLFGEAEDILKLLEDHRKVLSSPTTDAQFIDSWLKREQMQT